MLTKEKINIVWLKRDLRLQDNEAISNAISTKNRVLFIYVFENSLLNDQHYSNRHWNFIKESLVNLNERLVKHHTKVLTITSEVVHVCNQIQTFYEIDTVFSHQETGLLVTYNRDKDFTRYCKNNSIKWVENNNNGILRGLLHRTDWFEQWDAYMSSSMFSFTPKGTPFLNLDEITKLENIFFHTSLATPKDSPFQKGGTKMAYKYADSFFSDRLQNYAYNISSPNLARKSCSRLSPYIAWGNVSIREIFQKAQAIKITQPSDKSTNGFISRLRWQAHFIQKFEMEHTMENASINKGYQKLKKNISDVYQKAWQEGNTGFPLVDASMRCLNETGYLNFRMRAMLISFFTHSLWQPWQAATQHLSQQFLDFEPGIHFPQLQMNAGETGINEIRIYNPFKNSIKHDKEAIFIKKWCPELDALPLPFIHAPYLMTPLEEQFNRFELGINYPKPIIDLKISRKKASDILWNLKKTTEVREENYRILKKHVINNANKRLLEQEE
jgi:deoxyribodipyrimidine photo-lyase